MQALYRKYRPQTFKELVDQNYIKVTVTNEIVQEKIGHAYLFTGPKAVGKTTVARLLAKAINCEKRKKGEHEPCNKCDSCKEVQEGNSLDLLEIDAASHTGVDNVRENIIAASRIAPSRRKFKVFIIDEVHMLSISAFNALLKTLEEPPANVVFILATTEIHKVPPTIISRCQRFDFKKILAPDIVKRLKLICQKEKKQVAMEVLADVARQSNGHLRDAESMLGQLLSLGDKIDATLASLVIPRSDYNLVVEYLEFLADKKARQGIELINRLIDEGIDLGKFSLDTIEFLRKILLIKADEKIGNLSLELDEELEKRVKEIAQKMDVKKIIVAINLFMEKRKELKFSDIVQLPLEVATIELCEVGDEGLTSKIGSLLSFSKEKEEVSDTAASKTQTKPVKKEKVDMTASEVKKHWPELVARVKEFNNSLPFILKIAELQGITKDKFQIKFGYKIHEDKIKEKKIKHQIEDCLSEVYGRKLKIEFIECEAGDKRQEEKVEVQDGLVGNILNVLGGRVVK